MNIPLLDADHVDAVEDHSADGYRWVWLYDRRICCLDVFQVTPTLPRPDPLTLTMQQIQSWPAGQPFLYLILYRQFRIPAISPQGVNAIREFEAEVPRHLYGRQAVVLNGVPDRDPLHGMLRSMVRATQPDLATRVPTQTFSAPPPAVAWLLAFGG